MVLSVAAMGGLGSILRHTHGQPLLSSGDGVRPLPSQKPVPVLAALCLRSALSYSAQICFSFSCLPVFPSSLTILPRKPKPTCDSRVKRVEAAPAVLLCSAEASDPSVSLACPAPLLQKQDPVCMRGDHCCPTGNLRSLRGLTPVLGSGDARDGPCEHRMPLVTGTGSRVVTQVKLRKRERCCCLETVSYRGKQVKMRSVAQALIQYDR